VATDYINIQRYPYETVGDFKSASGPRYNLPSLISRMVPIGTKVSDQKY
jgi:hypothetical protein